MIATISDAGGETRTATQIAALFLNPIVFRDSFK